MVVEEWALYHSIAFPTTGRSRGTMLLHLTAGDTLSLYYIGVANYRYWGSCERLPNLAILQ